MSESKLNLVFIALIPIILSAITFMSFDWLLSSNASNCSLNIFIAILSERKNFNKRQTLRKTWIETIDGINNNNSLIELNPYLCKIALNYKFIIGDKDCSIPELFRKSHYSCDLNELKYNESNCQIYLHEFNAIQTHNVWHQRVYRGFSFVTRHSVLVTQIGIHQNFLNDNNITVVLLSAQNKEIIKRITISKNSMLYNRVYYESIEPLVLDKDFYGLLIIDNELIEFDVNYDTNVTLNQNGFFTILRAYYGFTDFESIGFKTDLILGPTLVYKVSDLKAIESLMKAQNHIQMQWNNELLGVEERLSQEMVDNSDIVVIKSIDVYRNLAEKVLQSIRYAIDSYELSHYLKTDDDCYLNVFNIINHLIQNYNLEKVWFGNFRRVWPLDYWGKWAENDYNSPLYPAFACGSGYVLSADLVQWISSNVNHLHRFQGEDVSMGVWMSALNPRYIDDKRWVCDNNDLNVNESFSSSQLEDKQIVKIHKFLSKIHL